MNMFLRLVILAIKTRLGRGVDPLGPCSTGFRVAPTDLDLLGHMNNGIYFSIFDLARIDLMMRSGLVKRMRRQGWYPVVTAETASFRRSLKPFRRFTVHTGIIGWDERHLFLEHHVTSDGESTTTAVIQARFLTKSGETVPPADLVELLPQEPRRPELPDWIAQWSKSTHEHSTERKQSLL